jgi:Protein of unknown function DUF45
VMYLDKIVVAHGLLQAITRVNRVSWPAKDRGFVKAPMFVIDYVIIHELAHIIEPNHTSRFWGIVRAHNPTMDKAKSWLKEHGQVLEEQL